MFGEALRLIRVFHDMKQSELASRLGISGSYLSEIERGKKEPSLDLVERYSAEFEMPMSSILFFSESIDDAGAASEKARKSKGVIAKKVVSFLSLIETRTESNEA